MSVDAPALLPSRLVRARKHWVLVALVFGVQLLAALLVSWPLGSVARATYGAHPRGDTVLFAPGGMDLVDFVLRELAHALPALLGHALVTLPVALVLHVLAWGAAIATLGFDDPEPLRARAKRAVGVSATHAHRLIAQTLVFGLVQLLIVVIAIVLGSAVTDAVSARMTAPSADRLGLAIAVPLALLVFLVAIVRDVAAIRVVLHEQTAWRGARSAVGLVMKKPLLVLEYVWRGGVGLGLIAFAALIANRIGGKPGAALFVLFCAHQAVSVMRVALRVSWLAAAIRRTG